MSEAGKKSLKTIHGLTARHGKKSGRGGGGGKMVKYKVRGPTIARCAFLKSVNSNSATRKKGRAHL